MNKKMKTKNRGFTLVELLVIIAVIGILATLAVIALQQARSRTRDSKRVADIKQIQTTLELFFNEQGRYPTIDEWNSGSIIVSSTNQVLMQNVPSAPYPADGSCSADQNNFYYIPSDDYSTYNLSFCLGSGVSDLSEGPKCLTPGGIINFDCSGDGSEENENNENTANVCPQECDFGYICQSGSCVVDTFQCGQNISYNGYSYPTVEIGTQCWFKENLRTDKFRNGNVIANVTTQWNVTGGVGPAWCHYNNDSNNENTYGKLYSVYAALDPRGICPPGFRLPTRAEFDSLISFAGSNRHGLLSCRQVDSPLGGSCATDQHPRWNSSASYNGNDSLGFSALPGGSKEGSSFVNLGVSGHFWTFTPYQTTRMYEGVADISNSNGFYSSLLAYFTTGRSIRCIKNNNQGGKTLPSVSITTPTNITANKATSGGNITNTGGSIVYAMGVVWSESDTPIVGASNSQFLNTIGVSNTSFTSNIVGLWPNKTYYIRAYAVNEVGLAYSNTISFTTPDPCGGVSSVSYNGYSYPTVGIGTQCWFKENLRTDKFKNGDSIPNVTTQWNISGGVGPAWCAYNNDMNNETNYGKLYSSYAVLDSRGLCPDGWRVPSQTDFDNLVSAATPYNGFSLHSCRMVNSPLGGSCATDQHPRWNYSSAYTGTDIFGFSALPGGYKYGATFYNLGVSGHFWTTTPYQTTRLYDGRAIYDNANGFLTSIGDTYFTSARSVRCIKN